jgi:hypothetical protein
VQFFCISKYFKKFFSKSIDYVTTIDHNDLKGGTMLDKFGEDLVLGDIVEVFVYDANNNKTKIKCRLIAFAITVCTQVGPNSEVATPSENQVLLKLFTSFVGRDLKGLPLGHYFFSNSNEVIKVGHDSDQGKCNHKFIPMFNGVCCKFCGTYK